MIQWLLWTISFSFVFADPSFKLSTQCHYISTLLPYAKVTCDCAIDVNIPATNYQGSLQLSGDIKNGDVYACSTDGVFCIKRPQGTTVASWPFAFEYGGGSYDHVVNAQEQNQQCVVDCTYDYHSDQSYPSSLATATQNNTSAPTVSDSTMITTTATSSTTISSAAQSTIPTNKWLCLMLVMSTLFAY